MNDLPIGFEDDYIARDEIPKYADAQEWIKEMIHHMYDTGDIEALEKAFDELTGIWGLRLPEHEPKIEKRTEYMPHSKGEHLKKDIWEMGEAMMKEQRSQMGIEMVNYPPLLGEGLKEPHVDQPKS